MSVHFSHELYRVNESSGPAELELVLEGKAAIPVTVAVGTLELTNSSTRMGATGRHHLEWEGCVECTDFRHGITVTLYKSGCHGYLLLFF